MTEWRQSFRKMSDRFVITDEARLLSSLGLATKAGASVIGVPLICEALKRKGEKAVKLVFEASDSSDNTHKRITDRCAYYNVRHIRLGVDAASLAAAVGKSSPVAAIAVTDENICRLAEKYIRFAL